MRLIENSEVYVRVCKLADETALAVHNWGYLAQKTVGVQLVTALDSVGANLVEGDGRGPSPDAIRFWRYARGSAREARHWFNRASSREYLNGAVCKASVQELTEIVLMIHALIRHREDLSSVREQQATYDVKADTSQFDVAWAEHSGDMAEEPKFPHSLIS